MEKEFINQRGSKSSKSGRMDDNDVGQGGSRIECDNIRWKEDCRGKGFHLIVKSSGLEAAAGIQVMLTLFEAMSQLLGCGRKSCVAGEVLWPRRAQFQELVQEIQGALREECPQCGISRAQIGIRADTVLSSRGAIHIGNDVAGEEESPKQCGSERLRLCL